MKKLASDLNVLLEEYSAPQVFLACAKFAEICAGASKKPHNKIFVELSKTLAVAAHLARDAESGGENDLAGAANEIAEGNIDV